MFDYGKTESRAARFAGTRFADAVEAFENTALMLIVDAYAVVSDGNHGFIPGFGYGYFYSAGGMIVTYSVFGKVFDKLGDML